MAVHTGNPSTQEVDTGGLCFIGTQRLHPAFVLLREIGERERLKCRENISGQLTPILVFCFVCFYLFEAGSGLTV